MGCFLGCFGGAKDQKRRKRRNTRASPQAQRNRVQNVQQEIISVGEQAVDATPITNLISEFHVGELAADEAPTTNLVSEFQDKPGAEQQLSPSPRKRVTFNSQVTAYEHVSIHGSVDSLPETINLHVEKEEPEDIKGSSKSQDENSSSVGSYPSTHRYHNARDSDDEADEYGDSDLDDLDGEEDDDYDDDEEDIDVRMSGQEIWSESVITPSMESRTGNQSPKAIYEEVESPMLKDWMPNEEVKSPMLKDWMPNVEVKVIVSKTNARDRSDYINSVLNPVENISQWKTVKSKGTQQLKPRKENLCEVPNISFSSEPTFKKTPSCLKLKSNQANEGIAVDTSLSTWLASPEPTQSKIGASGKTISDGVTSMRSFEDRPILGALTVDEVRQISAMSSPRKSPSRSPDEMPIIGTVGTYWNHSGSGKQSGSASSYKGIPNTTSKYREDKRVNWHSTPFETRLDRALKHGTAEA